MVKKLSIHPFLDRSEYKDQVAVFEWAARNEPKWPCLVLLFGSLMGISLPVRLLNKAKKAGMKTGKPDINLPVPIGGSCGLWIELKRLYGKTPTPQQVDTLVRLSAVGNATYSCKGSAAAIQVLESYLNGKLIRIRPPICEEFDPTSKISLQHIALEV